MYSIFKLSFQPHCDDWWQNINIIAFYCPRLSPAISFTTCYLVSCLECKILSGIFFKSSLLRIGIIFTDYLYIYLTNSVRHLLFDGPDIVYNKIPTLKMSDPTLISGLDIVVIVDVTINFTTIIHATCDMWC